MRQGFMKPFHHREAGQTKISRLLEAFPPVWKSNQLADIVGRFIVEMKRSVADEIWAEETENCTGCQIMQVRSQTLDRHGDQEDPLIA